MDFFVCNCPLNHMWTRLVLPQPALVLFVTWLSIEINLSLILYSQLNKKTLHTFFWKIDGECVWRNSLEFACCCQKGGKEPIQIKHYTVADLLSKFRALWTSQNPNSQPNHAHLICSLSQVVLAEYQSLLVFLTTVVDLQLHYLQPHQYLRWTLWTPKNNEILLSCYEQYLYELPLAQWSSWQQKRQVLIA